MHHNYQITFPKKTDIIHQVGQLIAGGLPCAIAQIVEQQQGITLLLTQDRHQALLLMEEIKQFSPHPVMTFDDWGTLPYDSLSPAQDVISNRLSFLYQLPHLKKGIVILPITTLLQKVCPKEFLLKNVLLVKQGESIAKEQFTEQLITAGYYAVQQVMSPGEFASRGSLVDLFPMGSHSPYRIDFFDNEIETIRLFDNETQRSLEQIAKIALLPAHEFSFNKVGIETFRRQWRENFDVSRDDNHLYQQISQRKLPGGIEYWQPLFHDTELMALTDYFPNNTLLLTLGDIQQTIESSLEEIKKRHATRSHDIMRPLLPITRLWQTSDQVFASLKKWLRIKLNREQVEGNNSFNFPYSKLPNIALQNHQASQLLLQFLNEFNGTVIFSVESQGRREVLLELLNKLKIHPKFIHSFKELEQYPTDYFFIMLGACEYGFIDTQQKIALITENDLISETLHRTRRENKKRIINTDNLIKHLAELKIGQPVVHLEHGVGRYLGLISLTVADIPAEFMLLEYANEAKLYLPISSLPLISRYSGSSEEHVPLHKLGSDAWSKAKKKAIEKITDVAAELLEIYAHRELKQGYHFDLDKSAYDTFCEDFPFELTDDQQQAIDAVLQDMTQGKVMDRLICGDVGFGKTEVAMRAAFLSVINHKQVAVLVPTTLLAQQHFDNFKDRFAQWPIRIEVISRFKTAKQQSQLLLELTEGKIDILIGTHKLLQPSIAWHDLGLLIVDEEHRFGVQQKERIKTLKTNIDILALTATPIPRTLNMALGGMRDLSIIATPPARRLAIKTFVRQFDSLIIREAMLREILRGGQCYYLFNDVKNITKKKEELEKLVPEASFAIAHGQMHERELERVMMDFHHQRFNILLCSTIIETGIDIPNANTIIIDRADKFGLAQLHQLRGRVGRSFHQAYAYLFTPPLNTLSNQTKQRLDAIASLEDLGAGFALATHDLEIRGAGELLGADQSGQIEEIGFSLYMEYLEQAIEDLKQGKEPLAESLIKPAMTEIELKLPSLIEAQYLPDITLRLSFYKRIANVIDEQQLNDIRSELIDRFGMLPEATQHLFTINQLRLKAQLLGLSKIEVNNKSGYVQFNEDHKVNVDYLFTLLKQTQIYQLEGQYKLKFKQTLNSSAERIKYVTQLLDNFMFHSSL